MEALIIHNEHAGKARRRAAVFRDAVDFLRASGWQVRVQPTTGPGHATALAREAVRDRLDLVIAASGDGTLNEVIQALAHTDCAAASLPLGTVNVWCQEVGFSQNPLTAARAMVNGVYRRVDLGCVNGRYFLLMVGAGLDGWVTANLDNVQAAKQRFGVLPVAWQSVKLIPRYRGAKVTLTVDGRRLDAQALMVLVANTRIYGGIMRLTPTAVADDGLLDLRLFPGNGVRQIIGHGLAIAGARLRRGEPPVMKIPAVDIDASPPLLVQVDGEPCGSTPLRISADRGALRVLVPRDYERSFIPGE